MDPNALADSDASSVAAGPPYRKARPLIGIAGFLLTVAGLAGVGDAPHPLQSGASMAAHFQQVDTAVLTSAPLGQLGAVALAAFMLALARRLHRSGATIAGTAVAAGGLVAASYLLVLHAVYASLAYAVAASSAEATKALFVATILAVPAFGIGVAVALGGAAYGAATSHLLPAWWSATSGIGAVVAAFAVVSYADSGFFSPDVQQQVVGNVLLLWLIVTAATIAMRPHADIR